MHSPSPAHLILTPLFATALQWVISPTCGVLPPLIPLVIYLGLFFCAHACLPMVWWRYSHTTITLSHVFIMPRLPDTCTCMPPPGPAYLPFPFSIYSLLPLFLPAWTTDPTGPWEDWASQALFEGPTTHTMPISP